MGAPRYPEPWILKHIPAGRFAYRFLTGRPLDGIRRTDAIFLRPARNSLDPSGYASWWSRLAGWQRLAYRLAFLYVFAWSLALLLAAGIRRIYPVGWAERMTWESVLIRHLVWSLALGVPVLIWWTVVQYGVRVRVPVLVLHRSGFRVWVTLDGWVPWAIEGRRTWERTYVRPLALAADSILGTYHRPAHARRWIQVPRTYRNTDGAPVVIRLPEGFTGADKGTMDRLVRAVSSRLGMRDPSVRWDLEGDRPRALFSAPPVPPSLVLFADIRDRLESAPEFAPVLGLAARESVLTGHMVDDSPHIAVSGGPGSGKSELIKGLAVQFLHWGWGLVVVDWKEVSHTWAKGLPGVTYVSDVADIHDMFVRLGEEVDIRKAAYRNGPDMGGRRKIAIICEEMNVTAELLVSYWETMRNTEWDPEVKRSMPRKSPAITAINTVNFAGRQLGMFIVYVAQRLSARATNGNADFRESFQIRLISGRSSGQTWKMLAPQIKPIPKMEPKPGRWCAVIGSDAVVFQATLITDEEAREFSLGGQENPTHPFATAIQTNVPNQRDPSTTLGDQLGSGPASPNQDARALHGDVLPPVDARKLSDMVDGLAHLGITLNVLQHASKDPESGFPGVYGGTPNRGYTYDYQAVAEWARKRHAARQAKRNAG